MNKRSKVIAASLCAAQLAAMIPVTASAAQAEISVNTISVGENHSLVIKSDMSLWAAGDNSKGQLGLGSDKASSVGEKVMDNIVFAEANDDVSFAIDKNGALYGWGDNTSGQVDPGTAEAYIYKPKKLRDNVEEVSAGDTHTVALLKDGSVVGWGSNDYGELGFSSNGRKNQETKLTDNASDIAAGDGFTLIVTKNGEVFACGSNDSGQLGTGSYRDTFSLEKVISSGAAEVEAGNKHSVVLMADGTVKTTGANDNGQLGTDDYSTGNSFENTKIRDASAVFAGGNSTGALSSSGVLYTWGDNDFGQLHNGKTEDVYIPEQITSGVVSVTFGEHHSLMLKNSGKVSSAGSGVYGELFAAQNTIISKPEYIDSKITSYSAGYDHAAAIDEKGALYTWGCNDKGQLGLGDYTNRSNPTKVKLNDKAEYVWCGKKVTIVQTSDKKVYVFGDNSNFMLGFSQRSSVFNKPTENEYLSDMGISQIEFGDEFTIALIGDAVWGWGRNSAGRLTSLSSTVKYPQQLDVPYHITKIAAGNNHCLAMTSGGELYGWGSNTSKQLGVDTDTRQVIEPVLIELKDKKDSVLSVSDIAAAGSHSMIVTTDGDVYAWGENGSGQLGVDSSRLRTPTRVNYFVSTIFTSTNFSAVIDSNDELTLSGSNTYGVLGDGTTKDHAEFVKSVIKDVKTVSLGENFAGCITTNDKLYCWGDNSFGQVGNGNGGVNTEPVTVINDGLCQAIAQAESVTLSDSTLALTPNKTARLTATVKPDNAVNKSVTWASSDTSVATVSDSGLVKSLKNGTAVITATTSNGKSAQCTVTVSTPVSSFSVSPAKTKTINVDGTFTFKPKVYPATADDKTLLYTSSNEDVAVVDENGTVTAISAGTTKITITARSNPAKTRTVTVNVRPDKVKITYRKSTADGIILNWSQSEYAEGYVIYRRNSSKGSGKNIGEVTSYDPDDLTFTDSTGVKGKTYYYYIKSYVTVDGKRIYSAASTIYKIKAK